jgi:hypothetical protein
MIRDPFRHVWRDPGAAGRRYPSHAGVDAATIACTSRSSPCAAERVAVFAFAIGACARTPQSSTSTIKKH